MENRTYELQGITHMTPFRKYGKLPAGPSTYQFNDITSLCAAFSHINLLPTNVKIVREHDLYEESLVISKSVLNMNPRSQRVGDSITLTATVSMDHSFIRFICHKFLVIEVIPDFNGGSLNFVVKGLIIISILKSLSFSMLSEYQTRQMLSIKSSICISWKTAALKWK